jgi:hypothetical protein
MFETPNPALVLLGTLLLWLPTLRNLLRGEVNVAGGAVRFGLALAVSWLAIDLIRRVLRSYSARNAGKHPQTPTEPTSGEGPGAVLAELRQRPLPESRLTQLRQDPHPSASGATSRLKRSGPPPPTTPAHTDP